jgi:hypothetical protein
MFRLIGAPVFDQAASEMVPEPGNSIMTYQQFQCFAATPVIQMSLRSVSSFTLIPMST